jgi:hypothetical protein
MIPILRSFRDRAGLVRALVDFVLETSASPTEGWEVLDSIYEEAGTYVNPLNYARTPRGIDPEPGADALQGGAR